MNLLTVIEIITIECDWREEPGFEEFLEDAALSGDARDEEIEFLKLLRFKDKRPTSLYYYRELQKLRDPLHFRASAQETQPDST